MVSGSFPQIAQAKCWPGKFAHQIRVDPVQPHFCLDGSLMQVGSVKGQGGFQTFCDAGKAAPQSNQAAYQELPELKSAIQRKLPHFWRNHFSEILIHQIFDL